MSEGAKSAFTEYGGLAIIYATRAFDVAFPYLLMIYEVWQKIYRVLKPYHPDVLLETFLGFTMMFFGGTYMTLIAAVEAYRMTSWEDTKKQLDILMANAKVAWEASRKDDLVDDDNDGIPDVEQIDQKELLARKTKLLISTIEPVQVSNALSGMYIGALAVLAVLKSRFAAAITLGAGLGEMLYDAVYPIANPTAKRVIPTKYHKWIPVVIGYGTKTIGVTIAWTIERFMACFYSAMRGAYPLVSGIIKFLKINGLCAQDFQVEQYTTGLGQLFYVGLAMSGVYWQVSNFFMLPFPWYIILWPLTVMEYVLMYFVNRD